MFVSRRRFEELESKHLQLQAEFAKLHAQCKEYFESPSYNKMRLEFLRLSEELELWTQKLSDEANRITLARSARERWQLKREERQAELEAVRSVLQQKAFSDTPQRGREEAPNQLELLPEPKPGLLKRNQSR